MVDSDLLMPDVVRHLRLSEEMDRVMVNARLTESEDGRCMSLYYALCCACDGHNEELDVEHHNASVDSMLRRLAEIEAMKHEKQTALMTEPTRMTDALVKLVVRSRQA